MHATIRLRTKQLRKYREMSGLTSDTALAAAMGAHRHTIYRTLRGDTHFSAEFIGSLLRVFPHLEFTDLFEVTDAAPVEGADTDSDAA